MNRLEQLLMDLTYDERIEALQYYEDYFADAGPDQEDEIIKELKSPEELAQVIKEDIVANTVEHGSTAYTGTEIVPDTFEYQEPEREGYVREENDRYTQFGEEKKKNSGMKLVLIILGAVFLGPVLLAIALSVLGVVFGLFAAAFGILLAAGGVGIGLIAGGVFLMVSSIVSVAVHAISSVFIFGAGLVLFGLGFLFIAAFILLIKFIKWLFESFVELVKRVFNRRGAYA